MHFTLPDKEKKLDCPLDREAVQEDSLKSRQTALTSTVQELFAAVWWRAKENKGTH